MYLIHLPRGLEAQYPAVNESRTAIRAEAPSTVKSGLPASVLASDIDVLPVVYKNETDWQPLPVRVLGYNPVSLALPSSRVSFDSQATKLKVHVAGIQEARGRCSWSGVEGEDWVAKRPAM